jgi:pimeloyl-ACP methyl ester carboxylesterase
MGFSNGASVGLMVAARHPELVRRLGTHGEFLGEAVMAQHETGYPRVTALLVDEFLDEP